jgi:non-heme chloroperoxidase
MHYEDWGSPMLEQKSVSSRRLFLVRNAAVAGGAALAVVPARATAGPIEPQPRASNGTKSTFTTADGTLIYFKDWGSGRPIVFSHGWPLTSDAWEDAMFFLSARGYRCIAADRRGHGRSSQPWSGNDMDTYADDLAALINNLDLRGAILVGHSTGGGEVARYIGRHGNERLAGAVLVSDITPVMLKSAANPNGTPQSVYDGIRSGVLTDRAKFFGELSVPFYGANRPGANVSTGLRDFFVTQCMMAGMPACYFGLKGDTPDSDFTADLKRIDVPTLIVHGSDDQLVPLADSALLSSKIVKKATLKVYEGAPHGLPSTVKDRMNADLLAFAGTVG